MKKERKASEVIQEIQSNIAQLMGFVRNTDANVKIILAQLNNLVAEFQKPEIKQKQFTFQQPKLPPGPKKELEEDEVTTEKPGRLVAQPAIQTPYYDDEIGLEEEVINTGARRSTRSAQPVNNLRTNKIAVSQQLLLNDGSPLFLANIEIKDDTGTVVKQTRTNAKGRWIAPLTPGLYTVHISKRMSADSKRSFEKRYSIEIPESVGPLELPSPELSGS